MQIKISAILLFATFIACKNKSSVTTTKMEEKKTIDPVTSNIPIAHDSLKTKPINSTDTVNYSLVIMFYSIGEGAENEQIKLLEDSISAYSGRIGKKINIEKSAWGREGETDFCMQLFELTDVEKQQFISQIKIQLKKAKWVNIYENYPYRRHKQRK